MTFNVEATGWSEARVDLLKKLWAEGLTASEIAKQLGVISRNSVIGKVHRLGLSGRARSPAVSTAPRQRKARVEEDVHVVVQPVSVGNTALAPMQCVVEELQPEARPVAEIVTLGQHCTILDLTESKCRWPIGDPGSADFCFCGSKTAGSLPYCAPHCRIAYQPVTDRRRDRRVMGG